MSGDVGDLIVKFSKKEYTITGLSGTDTIKNLKDAIYRQTGVLPEHQKLAGFKVKAGQFNDSSQLSTMMLKPNMKLTLIGTRAEDIDEVRDPPADMPEVINDFDIEDEEVAIENREEYLAKVKKRVKEHRIIMYYPPRDGKKLLVLDIDYTLFDHRSTAETPTELMRPYLHEFLTSAYVDYDIVIWSATSMKWIETKLNLLGVTTNPNYKICFYLCSDAMISVHTPKYGVIQVKPLGVIWGKFDMWSEKNTIMIDDVRRNFIMNPKNGLRIKAFREAHSNRLADKELMKLAEYLQDIADVSDLSRLDHRKWESYKRPTPRKPRPEHKPPPPAIHHTEEEEEEEEDDEGDDGGDGEEEDDDDTFLNRKNAPDNVQ
ncbi:ubiquitin-like domain-containing CTD phosphatase 1 [Pomacea canaliculata]|uniref:ubiquitin-like domain-containing CTD phosphatase 1 n=1 Tax=Pomacea canaliculata TaxID=400727 RepID=UPI000D739400|nr:ubiquitin-like domain-containing CTD phosphatase 1 [Pomacea canaliculata]